MAYDRCLLICAAVVCASAPVAQALSPVAAGVLSTDQRRSRPAAEPAVAPARPERRSRPVAEPAVAPASPNRGEASLCKQGRLIPELYVLGVKNSATTSLAHDLRHRGVFAAPQDKQKEWWFFGKRADKPVAKQERQWLHSFPPCPAERMLMADFSVTNLYEMPFPDDLSLTSEFGYHMKSAPYWDTASRISQFSGKAAKDLKFLVMLRDPLARIQSEYYHTLPLENCWGCMANDSFAESFAFNVKLLQQRPPQVSDWFWRSFYARQVEEYLRHFDAAQFAFVPNRQYFAVDPPAFSAALLDRLGLHAKPWAKASHKNLHDQRPPLDAELPPGTASREAFQAFFAAENERLVKALARAHLGGAWLPGYAGEPGDEARIRAWLEASW